MCDKEDIQSRSKIYELIRFGIVGIIATGTTYLLYYLLIPYINTNVSFAIGYFISLIINYILTTRFTFKVSANKKNGIGFIITNLINYFLCTLFLNIFIMIGVNKEIAPIPMYCVCIPLNFLLVRFVMKKYN